MRRLALTVATFTCMAALTACTSDDDSRSVTLGGQVADRAASSDATMLDRPWGTVPAAPEMETAETPSEADLVFIAQMLPHHRQALELAANALSHAEADDRIHASATFITSDQGTEIKAMEAWREAWASQLPETDDLVRDAGHDMPGMLSTEAVAEIAALPTDEAEVAYLVRMIEHHEGAVTMAHAYLADAVNSYTLSTARHAIREQKTEVAWMQKVIDDLCSDDDAPRTCPAA